MKSINIVVFFISCVLAKYHKNRIIDILKPNENYFRRLNDKIQHTMNNVFKPLNLSKKFNEIPKIKLLLKMHYDLKDIVERNYKVYMEMRNMSRVDKVTINGFHNMIEEILADEIKNALRGEDSQVENVSEFNNSIEFMDLVDKFIKKIDRLSVKDFTKPPLGRLRSNLKAWVPSSLEKPGRLNTTNRRLYRGEWAKVSKYPFVASVHVMGQFECGASIIAQDLVITAASCLQLVYKNRFYQEKVPSVEVRVGSDYATHGGKLITAEFVQFHPGYDPRTLKHNLAIIRLRSLIKFSKSKKRVRRIVLDDNRGHVPYSTVGIVSLGWGGRDRSNRPGFLPRLNVDTLRLYPHDQCKDIYSRHYVTDQHFCAGHVSKGGGACNKDAGGPGVVGGVLTGIISFGPPSCGTKGPTVFTRVGPYSVWIQEIIQRERKVQHKRTTMRPQFTPLMISSEKETNYWVQEMHMLYPTGSKQDSIEGELFGQILNDIILSKSGIEAVNRNIDRDMQALLYGAFESDEIFKPTEKQDLLQHPLVNKSLVFIPEVYGITGTATHSYIIPSLTTSTVTPEEDYFTDVGGPGHTGPMTLTMPAWTYAPTIGTPDSSMETGPEPPENILRTLMDNGSQMSDEFSDNYE